ncbi:lysozyme [Brachybacterium endophyticum]|uniref:lysozyme n=1 Tax=Brachybacterium endophyticum TaxID=2182385 RepID=A0A2U2RIK9_9MICO|nr:GH25 family lysozyme [Brachybacterium endophyticum]PWH05722.1 lysozyme [Brachybacterium endophyticum]
MSRYVPRHARATGAPGPSFLSRRSTPRNLRSDESGSGASSRRALLRGGAVGVSALTIGGLASAPASAASIPAGIPGQDVSTYQGSVDWAAQKAAGSRYVFIKATEGATWRSSTFNQQYRSATSAGLIRGAYHFARPDSGDPEGQCEAFLNGGGGWSADGQTLPGLLDMEAVSGVPNDFGLSQQQLRDWISGFIAAYKAETGRRPMVYTNANWWDEVVGDFAPSNTPLQVAYYSSSRPSKMPGRWWDWDMWQFSDSGPFAGDSSVFQGTESEFEAFVGDAGYSPRGI